MDRGTARALAIAVATGLAAAAEGVRQVAYYDPPGILTVCYGSTHDVDATRVYTLAECRERLDTDMAEAVETVERCAPGLPYKPLAAFADAVYNVGPRIVCDATQSTLARYLREGKVEAACNELPKWNKARIAGVMTPLPGLSKRRRAERTLCLGLV